MSRLILHKLNPSPPSRAVMMVGHILNLKFDYKEVRLLKKEHHTPEFIEMNPIRTIPVLEDGDLILTDSHAICTYLINKYGGNKREELYPSDIKKRAIIDSRLHLNSGLLFPRISTVGFKSLRGKLDGPKEEHIRGIEEVYGILDLYLRKTRYLAADHITVADICAGATVTSQETIIVVDGNKYPNTKEWIESLKNESCFLEINVPGNEEYRIFLNKRWEKKRKENKNLFV